MAMAMVDVAIAMVADTAMVMVVVVVEDVARTTLAHPTAQPRKDCMLPLVSMLLTMGRRLPQIR